jgi:valyl-tRNA synthetase
MLNFYWHEFADYYIEDVKYRIYSEDKKMAGSKKAAAYTLRKVVVESLGLFAPIIPYVSEEINSWFSKNSIFEGSAPQYVEEIETSDYVINGLLFEEGFVKIDYEDIGAFVNNVIGEVRKRKSEAHMALNAEISTININVPEAYYKVSLLSKGEIEGICKAKNVEVKKGESFSVSISM